MTDIDTSLKDISSDDLIKQAIPLYKETADSQPFNLEKTKKFIAILKEFKNRDQLPQLKTALVFKYRFNNDPEAALRELARIEEANWEAAWEEWGKKEKGE